jgi:ion channel-forming bestrophin family protein
LLVAGVLGLLLVFRTNTAYDRFWEGRRLWSFLISRVRELARLGHGSLRGLDREHFLQLVAAFPPILLQHLQSGWKGWAKEESMELRRQADRELIGLVSKEDLSVLLPSNNRPFLLVKMIGNIIAKSYTDPERVREQRFGGRQEGSPLDTAVLKSALCTERLQAETMLMGVVEAIGGCERIVKTTVPVSYSRHTSRFLSVWCFTLPIVLVDLLQWRMIPLVFIAAWALSVIDEVGHIIEDPFNMAFTGTDELKLSQSFAATRLDVMERLPAKERSLLELGGNTIVRHDYDVTKFHQDYISRPSILRIAGSFPSPPLPSRSRRALVATAAASASASREWDEYIAPAPVLATAGATAGGSSGSSSSSGSSGSGSIGSSGSSGSGSYDDSLLVAASEAAAAGWDGWLAWQASASVLERQAVAVLGSVCAAAVAVSGSISIAEALSAAGVH